MELDKNEILILKLLITASDYMTTYDITARTNINRRLVRTKMHNIRCVLKELGFDLISKPAKGFLIPNKSYKSLLLLQNIIDKSEKNKSYLFPTLPEERQNYILKKLIECNDYLKVDDLADELLVSRSSISNDLNNIKKDIARYNLHFKQKPNYGIKIIGKEIDLRKPICDILFVNLSSSEMIYDFLDTFWANDEDFEIIRILNKHSITMSDIALVDFLLNVSVMISRFRNGYQIKEDPIFAALTKYVTDENEAAIEISQYIKNTFNVALTDQETNNLTALILCKRSTKGMTSELDKDIIELVEFCIKTIYQKTNITFNDPGFYRTFSLYLNSALIRQKYNEKIRNPLFNILKTSSPLAYQLSTIVSQVLEEKNFKKLSRSELAAFATVFNNAIFNKKNGKKKVLLLSGLGVSSEKLSSYLINEHFFNSIEIKKTSQYYKLKELSLTNYDFIISTLPIHRDLPIPVVNISHNVNKDDIERINNYLLYSYNDDNFILNFLPSFYQNHLAQLSYSQIVDLFYQTIKKQFPNIKESFKKTLLTEDNYIYNNFNNQVGLIKLLKPVNNNNNIIVLLFDEPIKFQSGKLQILVLFSAPNNNNLYNILLNKINYVANTPTLINQIFTNQEYTNFLRVLTNNNSES